MIRDQWAENHPHFFNAEPPTITLDAIPVPRIVVQPKWAPTESDVPPKEVEIDPRAKPQYEWHEAEKALEVVCEDGSAAFVAKDPSKLDRLARDARIRQQLRKSVGPDAHFDQSAEAIAASAENVVEVFDRASGARRFRVELLDQGEKILAENIAFSPAGDVVLVAANMGAKVRLLDPRTGQIRHTLDHGYNIRHYAFHPHEPLPATGSGRPVGGSYLPDDDADVILWNTQTGAQVKKLPGSGVAFSSDGKLFATWNYEAARIWEGASYAPRAVVKGVEMGVRFTPDSLRMLTPLTDTSAAHPGRFENNGFEVRDARSGKILGKIPHPLSEMHFNAEASQFLALHPVSWNEVNSSPSYEIGLHALPAGKQERLLFDSIEPIQRHGWIAGGRALAVWSRFTVQLMRISDGRSLFVIGARDAQGQCAAAVFDDSGHFDGPAEGTVAFRLGDDLREAELIQKGPRFESFRVPNLGGTFVDSL